MLSSKVESIAARDLMASHPDNGLAVLACLGW